MEKSSAPIPCRSIATSTSAPRSPRGKNGSGYPIISSTSSIPTESSARPSSAGRRAAIIGDLHGRKTVIVAGGTGLYIRALTGGIIEGPGPDEGLRKIFRERLESEDRETLYARLEARDPEAAGRIHPRDGVRIIRALEIAELAGEPISEKQRRHGFREARYECLKVGLYRDREELYRRIDSRASQMIEAGLVEEAEKILRMGYDEKVKPLQSLGYKYIIRYMRNKLTLEEALKLMQRDTRHYARRQMTWFRGEGGIEWFHPDETGPIRLRIERFLHGR